MTRFPPYSAVFYTILTCLSTSLAVHSALTPSHNASLNSCDSTQVEQTAGADEASQRVGYRHVAYYVVSSTIPEMRSASELLTNP